MQETRDSSPPTTTIAEMSPAAVTFGAFTLDLQARRLLRNSGRRSECSEQRQENQSSHHQKRTVRRE